MEFLEFEGKTTEEAIEAACAHFQVPSEELEIEIVSVGSPGFFGLGGRKAMIRPKGRKMICCPWPKKSWSRLWRRCRSRPR
jgi:spoIIIJ-associated protein